MTTQATERPTATLETETVAETIERMFGKWLIDVLVIGSGAREHTLVWKISQSPLVSEIYCAPGNGGTCRLATNLPISATDVHELVLAAKKFKIGIVVIGPDAPLAAGLVDALIAEGIPAFGPTAAAALIESSKIFAANLMDKYGISHARGINFFNYHEARSYLLVNKNTIEKEGIVIKADGLAAGKGAIVVSNLKEALEGLDWIMLGLGDAGTRVRIEERLIGKEFSFIVFTDGKTILPLPPACDYKRAYDGDIGPNTGGMGAYSPSNIGSQLTKEAQVIMQKAVNAMAAEGRPFKGVLYGGFIMTKEGLKVLEFNARFGDPETQVQLPRVKTDLVDIMLAVINGKLHEIQMECIDDFCVGVVMATKGYPGDHEKSLNCPIEGLETLDRDVLVFHAGTKIGQNGQLLTDGGRVLTVVVRGKNWVKMREKAYTNISRIKCPVFFCRKDIAERLT